MTKEESRIIDVLVDVLQRHEDEIYQVKVAATVAADMAHHLARRAGISGKNLPCSFNQGFKGRGKL
jgi:hypothetical protein